MKSFAVVGILLLSLAVPRLSAQITAPPPLVSIVVGENNATIHSEGIQGTNAQQFSLSSGAYVSGIALTLFGDLSSLPGAPSEVSCSLTYAITDRLNADGSLGTLFLQGSGSVNIDSTLATLAPFSAGFPSVHLPAGTYYLVVNTVPAAGGCTQTSTGADLFWPLNTSGSIPVGTVGLAFVPSPNTKWGVFNGVAFAFDLLGPILLPPPVGGGAGQIARLLIEGPVRVPPGGPVQAELGFMDSNGNQIGPSSTVTLGPGQIQSVDLDLGQFAGRLGERAEVQPIISQVPGAIGAVPVLVPPLKASVQVLDKLTGLATLEAPLAHAGDASPGLVPQALSLGQTMRLNVAAPLSGSCSAQLSFADQNGSPLGPTLPVNLSPGTAASLDLNASALAATVGRSEVQPIVTITPAAAAGPAGQGSTCQASVEVFDRITARTWTYQASLVELPAVQ